MLKCQGLLKKSHDVRTHLHDDRKKSLCFKHYGISINFVFGKTDYFCGGCSIKLQLRKKTFSANHIREGQLNGIYTEDDKIVCDTLFRTCKPNLLIMVIRLLKKY